MIVDISFELIVLVHLLKSNIIPVLMSGFWKQRKVVRTRCIKRKKENMSKTFRFCCLNTVILHTLYILNIHTEQVVYLKDKIRKCFYAFTQLSKILVHREIILAYCAMCILPNYNCPLGSRPVAALRKVSFRLL